tara:strand:+ start:1078 stop:1662 length:585 start_codon:yes stop_codon:yes gene_type:complete
MGFKLKSGNTTTFKMMGSSPMHSHEPGHIPTEQELREKAAREARAESEYEQGTTTNPEAMEVAEDAKTKTPEVHGKYKESQVKEMLAEGLDGLSEDQIAKLSRTGQLNSAGQSNISKSRLAELNSTLEARKRASEETKTPTVEDKKPSEKITEYYFTPDGKARSKTGHPDPKTGKLPAYEHQGVTTNPLIGTNK